MAARNASSRLARRALQLPEDEAEHLLMPATIDQTVQCAGDDLARRRAAHDARHHPRQDPSRPAVLHGGKQPGQHSCQRDSRGPRRGRISKEAVHDPRQVQAGQARWTPPGW